MAYRQYATRPKSSNARGRGAGDTFAQISSSGTTMHSSICREPHGETSNTREATAIKSVSRQDADSIKSSAATCSSSREEVESSHKSISSAARPAPSSTTKPDGAACCFTTTSSPGFSDMPFGCFTTTGSPGFSSFGSAAATTSFAAIAATACGPAFHQASGFAPAFSSRPEASGATFTTATITASINTKKVPRPDERALQSRRRHRACATQYNAPAAISNSDLSSTVVVPAFLAETRASPSQVASCESAGASTAHVDEDNLTPPGILATPAELAADHGASRCYASFQWDTLIFDEDDQDDEHLDMQLKHQHVDDDAREGSCSHAYSHHTSHLGKRPESPRSPVSSDQSSKGVAVTATHINGVQQAKEAIIHSPPRIEQIARPPPHSHSVDLWSDLLLPPDAASDVNDAAASSAAEASSS